MNFQKEEEKEVGDLIYNQNPDKELSIEGNLVFRGRLKNVVSKDLIIRKIKKSEYSKYQERIDREVKATLESFKLKNVLNIEKIEEPTNGDYCYIAYEHFEGTLATSINESTPIKLILLTASEGLMHFHDKDFIHRNICPGNIVICEEDKQLVGKITDLSFSKCLSKDKQASISRDFSENLYSAPELIKLYDSNPKFTGKVGYEVDVFSMGIVYFYTLTGFNLFQRDGKSVEENISDEHFQPSYKTLEKSKFLKIYEIPLAKQLIKSMVQYNAKSRPTIKQVLNHPFFWSDNQKEYFLFVASQFIQGIPKIKQKFNMNFSEFEDDNETHWVESLDEEVKKVVEAKRGKTFRPYKNEASELLRCLRNIPAHINEQGNKKVRNIFEKYNGYFEYFSIEFPSFFYYCYNFFNDPIYSSYDTLRKFYCDCYLTDRYTAHKCNEMDIFNHYKWLCP